MVPDQMRVGVAIQPELAGESEPFFFYALEPSQHRSAPGELGAGYAIEFWSPSPGRPYPNGLEKLIGRGTLLFWWLHSGFTRRQNAYRLCLIRRRGRIVHYSGLFAKNPRFPFMDEDDIQVGPVWTDPVERGKRLQRRALDAIAAASSQSRLLWWLCRASNEVSNVVARKGGFRLVGTGRRTRRFGLRLAGAFRLEHVALD